MVNSESVPQGNVIGQVLWNVYLNSTLHLIPEAYVYTDDCKISFIREKYKRTTTDHAVCYHSSSHGADDGRLDLYQIKVLLISHRQDLLTPPITTERKRLNLTREISILGVQFDNHLTFTSHVKNVAKRPARSLTSARRISRLLGLAAFFIIHKFVP